jgi:hypothetical protein
MLFAFFAMFFHRQFFFDLLLISFREMIDGIANTAFHLDQIFSCHKIYLYN